jgi:hypothetical protein
LSTNSPSANRFEVSSSRWWALFTFKPTKLIFRDKLAADDSSVFAKKTYFWLTPWIRDENHMRISHIAEIEHERGLIWDQLTIESTGGLSPIVVRGLPKGDAQRYVAHVRGLMGRSDAAAR